VGYLLADLTERNALSVHLPEDRPGSLRELLNVFEQHRISLASIHSSRTPGGEVHFRIGFVAGSDPAAITRAAPKWTPAASGGCWAEFIHRRCGWFLSKRVDNPLSPWQARLSRWLVKN
jgi:hypothetical protein